MTQRKAKGYNKLLCSSSIPAKSASAGNVDIQSEPDNQDVKCDDAEKLARYLLQCNRKEITELMSVL